MLWRSVEPGEWLNRIGREEVITHNRFMPPTTSAFSNCSLNADAPGQHSCAHKSLSLWNHSAEKGPRDVLREAVCGQCRSKPDSLHTCSVDCEQVEEGL